MRYTLVLIPIVLTTCGIPMFSFIEGPEESRIGQSTSGPGTVIFVHNTDNNTDEFLGYILYYKFYDNSSTSQNADAWQTERSRILADPVTFGTGRLETNGFHQVRVINNDTGVPDDIAPTIRIPASERGISVGITIDLAEDSPNQGTAVVSGRTIDLYRNATQRDSYKRLLYDDVHQRNRNASLGNFYEESDEDIDDNTRSRADAEEIIEAVRNDDLYVALYVVAYGISAEFRPFFSEPVFLRYLSLQGNAFDA